MSSNLIQNYISAQKSFVQVSQKPKPDFDIQHELDNRTFIKPLRGRGRLLTGNLLSSPKYTVDNILYNMRAFLHAAKGEANDHELGKINDLGLMTGGLSIASYLATKRYTPMTKGMEFVGFGAFLASMALWPKLAIQLPAYLIHGVNVKKEYQDSFGRKKPFYQDPQFIPWDLYSDEQIQKIGDRLGVDKNMPNRRDFIQERMRKLAVQNNTLWMMTAGFATPVMTALICNASEPYLTKQLEKYRNKKADRILVNLNEYSKKFETKSIENSLNTFSKQNLGKQIDDKLIEKVYETLSQDLDAVTSESLKKDLKALMSEKSYLITEDITKNISNGMKTILLEKDFSKDFVNSVIPNQEEMLQIFKENDFLKAADIVDIRKIQDKIVEIINGRTEAFNAARPDLAESSKIVRKFIFSNSSNPLNELKSVNAKTFDSKLLAKLKNAANILDGFRAKLISLDEYALTKVGSAPETVIANYWNDVSKDLIKMFGITDKELENVRFDKNLMGKLLREKIENIVSDRNTYEKVMNSLVEKVATLNAKVKSSDMTSHMLKGDIFNPDRTTYEKAVDTVFDGYASALKEAGYNYTANALKGIGDDEFGSAKAIQKAYAEERLLGVKSSFYRLINALDFYRRVAANPNDLKTYNQGVPRGVLEELIELCKIMTLEGHSSDYATKFYMLRNPHPEADYSPLEVENGKIKNAHLGKTSKGLTDIPNDKYFYQNAMKFMFGDEMHPETRAILEKSILKDEMTNYRRLVMDKIGGENYFWKPRHRVSSSEAVGSDIKFLLTGIAPNELLYKQGQQLFNTRKWLKIFGGFGVALLGFTVFMQFFLGKLKAPQGGRK